MYRSVIIFAFCALSVSALTLTDRNPVDKVQERCANEHGLDQVMIAKKTRVISENDTVDPTLMCFAACMWRGRGMLNEDGTLNAPLVTRNLPREIADRQKVAQAFHDCAKEKGENVCETVSKTMRCLYGKEAFRNMHPVGTPFEQAPH